MPATAILTMATIIKDAEDSHGYLVVSAKWLGRVENGYRYAFYALKKSDVTGENEDAFFVASHNYVNGIRYKPMSATEFYANED
jgi:hypothetical protein